MNAKLARTRLFFFSTYSIIEQKYLFKPKLIDFFGIKNLSSQNYQILLTVPLGVWCPISYRNSKPQFEEKFVVWIETVSENTDC